HLEPAGRRQDRGWRRESVVDIPNATRRRYRHAFRRMHDKRRDARRERALQLALIRWRRGQLTLTLPPQYLGVVATFDLYLESGPQRKKTLLHVLDLLGCVVQADTTDEALAAAPEAIRSYLRYLKRHGERVDPGEAIQTRLAEHNTEGMFSGQAMWPQDLKPVVPAALARYTRWLDWSRADLLALVNGIDEKGLRAKPAAGRSLRDILLHVLGADKSYVYGLVGPLKAMGEPTNAADRGELDLRVALKEARAVAIDRLKALTPA